MPPPYRLTPTLHQKLAGYSNRPVDTAGGQRLQIGVDSTSESEVYHGNTCQSESGGGGSTETASQRSNSEGQPQYISRIFLVPKKDGSFRPVVNLRPLDQLVHFQDGEPSNDEGPTEGRRLHRLEGYVSVSRSLGAALEVPLVLMDGCTV